MLSALKTLPKLIVLDMQILYGKELKINKISMYMLFHIGIDKKGT
jgi:hypothetical protein